MIQKSILSYRSVSIFSNAWNLLEKSVIWPICLSTDLFSLYIKTFIQTYLDLDYTEIIYAEACNSSSHEKFESIKYNDGINLSNKRHFGRRSM